MEVGLQSGELVGCIYLIYACVSIYGLRGYGGICMYGWMVDEQENGQTSQQERVSRWTWSHSYTPFTYMLEL
jgi:hypothetical protein